MSGPLVSAAGVPGLREALVADLNPAQVEAVTHPGGPLLIVAGAGSGKTRVLARRAAWLVAGGLPGRALLAITFTNKAADVLRSRLAGLPGGADVWAGTFHGFGAWLLRRHGVAIGVDPHFTIADREDQARLVKTLLDERDLDATRYRPAALQAWISRRKNDGGGTVPREWQRDQGALEALAQAYDERLHASSLLDFDDLLLEARRLLVESPEAVEDCRARFVHVLVDEYQDTNRVQRDLVLRLLGPAKNLTVVGDPDQSIYRWRGATVANILNFAEDLPGARTVVLERNYRSTARILAAAEAVIARNVERHAKRLTTDQGPGEKVRVVRCADARDEAEVVADAVSRWRAAGRPLSGVGVIYRVNALSRAVELALRARGLPYRVVAGVEFFQRQEVKDVLAYARLVENPRDGAAFARIANVPRRGVGDTSLARLRALSSETGRPWEDVVRGEAPRISKKALAGLRALADLLRAVRALPRAPVEPLLRTLVEQSGYGEALAGPDADPIGTRAENVRELLAAAHEFDRAEPDGDLRAYLEKAGLVSDQDALQEGAEAVSLLSAHAAKGLEFPFVIVVGAENGLFPHARSAGGGAELEEERRLFYVAMTRAMERLLLTHAAARFAYVAMEPRAPSPFLSDIPATAVQREDRAGPYARPWRPGGAGSVGEGEPTLASWAAAAPADDVSHGSPGEAPHADPAREHALERAGTGLAPGDRVRHPLFGLGEVFACEGLGSSLRWTVDFVTHGRRTLIPGYANLERLP
jgi:DNA helicase-2/ATP-dependent DNA helicase PcrA